MQIFLDKFSTLSRSTILFLTHFAEYYDAQAGHRMLQCICFGFGHSKAMVARGAFAQVDVVSCLISHFFRVS